MIDGIFFIIICFVFVGWTVLFTGSWMRTLKENRLTAGVVRWAALRLQPFVRPGLPSEGINSALGVAGSPLWWAGIRWQCVVVEVGRGRVGAQRQWLFQAAAAAAAARDRQWGRRWLAGRQATLIGTSALVRFLAWEGGYAAGIVGPAVGQAGVQPGTISLTGKGRGLAKACWQAARGLIGGWGEVAVHHWRGATLFLWLLPAVEGLVQEVCPL